VLERELKLCRLTDGRGVGAGAQFGVGAGFGFGAGGGTGAGSGTGSVAGVVVGVGSSATATAGARPARVRPDTPASTSRRHKPARRRRARVSPTWRQMTDNVLLLPADDPSKEGIVGPFRLSWEATLSGQT
jgi:hypothetical protein